MNRVESFVRRALRPRYTREKIIEEVVEKFGITRLEAEGVLERVEQERQGVRSIDIEKIKRELEFYKKEYEAFKEKRNVVDEIISLCRANIEVLKEPRKVIYPKLKTKFLPETAVILFGDIHYGFNVSELEVPHSNLVYNFEVANKRLERIAHELLDIVNEKRKTRNISDLVVCFLGDIVEGNWTSINATKDDIVRQVFTGTRQLAEILSLFSSHFEEVRVYCVFGNHGVINKAQPEYVNWDYIFYRFLEEMLSDIGNVKFTVPTVPYCIFQVYDYRYCLMHGGNIKMFYRTPYYGIETADIQLKSILSYFGDSYNVLILGHFHQPAFLPTQSGLVLLNGSLTGYTPFGFKIGRVYPPTQVCFGVHLKHKISWIYTLEMP